MVDVAEQNGITNNELVMILSTFAGCTKLSLDIRDIEKVMNGSNAKRLSAILESLKTSKIIFYNDRKPSATMFKNYGVTAYGYDLWQDIVEGAEFRTSA